mgnify:CR=1 FL=1
MPSYTGYELGTLDIGSRGYSRAPRSELCRVFLRWIKGDGQPAVGRIITFDSTLSTIRHLGRGGATFLSGDRVAMTTDASGQAEIFLLRGATFEVSMTGTGITRRVTIPEAVTANLLDLVGEAADQFSIARITPVDSPRFTT